LIRSLMTKESDVAKHLAKIQAQLAVLDRKLDAFMTKSLTELAQAKAAAEKKVQHAPPVQYSAPRPQEQRPGRQMYAIVCHSCGKDAELPFKPSGDRPVYCQECFAKKRAEQRAAANPAGLKPQMSSIAPSGDLAAAKVEPKKAKKAAVKKAASKKAAVKKKAAKKK
jgi:CxxC-x17-CxxC domain-containing protein